MNAPTRKRLRPRENIKYAPIGKRMVIPSDRAAGDAYVEKGRTTPSMRKVVKVIESSHFCSKAANPKRICFMPYRAVISSIHEDHPSTFLVSSKVVRI